MSGDLTHRERFRRVASRNRADRAVFDLCGSPQTCLDYAETRDALTRYLSLEPSGRDDGRLDERALVLLDIDTRRVGGMPTPPTVHSGIRRGVRHSPYGIGYIVIPASYRYGADNSKYVFMFFAFVPTLVPVILNMLHVSFDLTWLVRISLMILCSIAFAIICVAGIISFEISKTVLTKRQ